MKLQLLGTALMAACLSLGAEANETNTYQQVTGAFRAAGVAAGHSEAAAPTAVKQNEYTERMQDFYSAGVPTADSFKEPDCEWVRRNDRTATANVGNFAPTTACRLNRTAGGG